VNAPTPQDDRELRRRNLRFAIVLGMVAVAVYVAFFVIKGMG
jgi:uncharacterized membrane protein (DUF485 family)